MRRETAWQRSDMSEPARFFQFASLEIKSVNLKKKKKKKKKTNKRQDPKRFASVHQSNHSLCTKFQFLYKIITPQKKRKRMSNCNVPDEVFAC